MNDYLSMSNNGGVIPLDAMLEYIPLKRQMFRLIHHKWKSLKRKYMTI